MKKETKVIVVGLDCATPQVLFDWYRKDLPTISRLMEQGTWGPLQSTIPPITIPAWMSMMTSKDPGDLGVYGFRSRKPGSAYTAMDIANSQQFRHVQKVWDELGEAGKRVGLLGVPGTYPPTPVNGKLVSCFLAPDTSGEFTYPSSLKSEILSLCAPDDYQFDFANRTHAPADEVLKAITLMTTQRQKIFRQWVSDTDWDFLMMVEMGVDRIHHYLWHMIDPQHKDHIPGNPFAQQVQEYYQSIDRFIGELIALAPPNTIFYIVSDHGAKRMEGMFVINEWLIENGYLVLKEYPKEVTSIEHCDVNWEKTTAWAWGGFYSRLFINVAGREPEGIVPPKKVGSLLSEIKEKLLRVQGPNGEALKHQIYRSHELYEHPTGDVPDLLIFWGDLSWKVAGTIGYQQCYIDHDDRGLDFGVHDWKGVFLRNDPSKQGTGRREDLHILDVCPTILHDFGLPFPADLRGKVIS